VLVERLKNFADRRALERLNAREHTDVDLPSRWTTATFSVWSRDQFELRGTADPGIGGMANRQWCA